jgi:hypothetical protein
VLEVLGDGARADVEGAGDGKVGAAARGELEHLHLAVGQVGQPFGLRPGQRGTRALPIVRPPQRVAQRRAERAQQGAIVLGEILARPVQRDRGDLAVRRGGQAERNLVLDRYMPEEFRIKTKPVESLLTEEIANLGWLVRSARPVVYEQGMLVQVGLEHRQPGLIDASARIVQVISRLPRYSGELVVCDYVASDQVSHA